MLLLGSKLGRCGRCITATALGLGVSVSGVLWLGHDGAVLLRVTLYVIALSFGALAALHTLALVYRAITRLEASVTDAVGGCRCGGSARRQRRRRRT